MITMPIRNPRSQKSTPARFCDVEVNGGVAKLVKKDKERKTEILWDDLKAQVEAAISLSVDRAI